MRVTGILPSVAVLAVVAGMATLSLSPAAAASRAVRVQLPDSVVPLHYDVAIKPDAKALTFNGKVTIDLIVIGDSNSITLNAADLVFDEVRLEGEAAAPTITLDPKQQTARFTFASKLAVGPHRLTMMYHGQIYQQPSGLFALDYQAAGGKARALFTQFESTDARRMLPCFDEPARKASFTLSVDVPASQMALSNMPILQTTPLADGLQHVTFADTPKMSAYLLFFALGDFERVSKMVDGVDLGVVVKRGDLEQAAFALDVEAQILPFYSDYFGVKFPLPKLDLIAGPGTSQSFGAMENWGAIFSFEEDLLIDQRIATENDRQRVYLVTAHEMAHQWFGDLVTMDWWDDLWLNEGFASWMENKAMQHFHPEWNVWLQQLNDKQGAMQLDAANGTHPIITPIKDVLQAANAFDGITYNKGASVIRMFEAYVGADAWRDGIRRYMADHAYGNAVTDELWREVDAVSAKKITGIAHDFTLQSGVPLVSVDSVGQGYRLTEGRFGVDSENRKPRSWEIPVLIGQQARLASITLSPPKPSVAIEQKGVVNEGQTGYFRTHYDAASFAALRDAYAHLSADDQLGLLNDVSAEAEADIAPMADLLDLSAALPVDADPVVWSALIGRFNRLDQLYDGLPGQARFRAFVTTRLQPLVAKLGWDTKPGDPVNSARERQAALVLLGRMGEPTILHDAQTLFVKLVAGEAMEPSTRLTVLQIIARNATATEWDQLHHLAQNAATAQEKTDLYRLLGNARDPALVQKALALSLSGEAEATTAPGIIRSVSGLYPGLALSFTETHWSQLEPMLESMARVTFAPSLASGASDRAVLKQLKGFAAEHIPASGQSAVRKAEAQIKSSVTVREKQLPQVNRWLSQSGS